MSDPLFAAKSLSIMQTGDKKVDAKALGPEPERSGAGLSSSVRQERRRSDPNGDDLRQRQGARLARLSLTYLFAGLYLCVLGILYLQDWITLEVLQLAAGLVGMSYVIFYLLFATGLNLRSSTHNLRGPMTVTAIGIMLFVVYLAPATQMAFIPYLLLTFAFVMHRMSSSTMARLSAATLLVYALIIYLHHRQWADGDLLSQEIMQFVALALTLPGFVMLANRVQRLRSDLYQANRKIRDIEQDAQRDELLGCYNRRYIVAALEQQKRLADDTGEPLCLAVIDLDHFKQVNDRAGHLGGDDVLRAFSRIALSNIRQEDVFGRYGGEEFLLILPGTSLKAASHIAERLRLQVEQYDWPVTLGEPVTVSIGMTQHVHGESVLDLFSRTDAAMYVAKHGGRNRVVMEDPAVAAAT